MRFVRSVTNSRIICCTRVCQSPWKSLRLSCVCLPIIMLPLTGTAWSSSVHSFDSQQVSLITFKTCDKQQTKCCDYTPLHAVTFTLPAAWLDSFPLRHASPFAQAVAASVAEAITRRDMHASCPLLYFAVLFLFLAAGSLGGGQENPGVAPECVAADTGSNKKRRRMFSGSLQSADVITDYRNRLLA